MSAPKSPSRAVADPRRIPSSSVVGGPQRTGVRLGPPPPCVLGLLGSRPRPEIVAMKLDSFSTHPWGFGDSSVVAERRRIRTSSALDHGPETVARRHLTHSSEAWRFKDSRA